MDAAKVLTAKGHMIRVVSMPSTDVFDAQDRHYRESVLPSHIKARVAVEAGSVDYWFKYVGLDGKIIGMKTFGESAPACDVFEYFGITVEKVVNSVERL